MLPPAKNSEYDKDFVIENGVLKEYCGASVDVIIPEGVTEISEKCFAGSKIKSVVIPDSVKRIGRYAFDDCFYLMELYVSDELLLNNKNAFSEKFYAEFIHDYRRRKGLCQHCGGSFKGLFTKKCSKCTRVKNY